jgi:cytoskeletal protein RodZ
MRQRRGNDVSCAVVHASPAGIRARGALVSRTLCIRSIRHVWRIGAHRRRGGDARRRHVSTRRVHSADNAASGSARSVGARDTLLSRVKPQPFRDMPQPTRRIGDPGGRPPQPADRAAFSEFLLGARRGAGLSLDEIATLTKVPARHLDALEQGRVAELPRGVYRRSILRTYASAVGLEPSLVLERFSQAFGTDAAFSEWEIVPPPTGIRSPSSSPSPRAMVAVDAAPPASRAAATTTAAEVRSAASSRTVAFATVVLLLAAAAYVLIDPQVSTPEGVVDSDVAAAGEATSTSVAGPGGATPINSSDSPTTLPSSTSDHRDATSGASSEAAEPEPTAQAESLLIVESIPAGARVTVDGIGWGVTPITIRHLPPGVKRIRVTLEGYVGQERDVRIGDDGGVVSARLTLKPRN